MGKIERREDRLLSKEERDARVSRVRGDALSPPAATPIRGERRDPTEWEPRGDSSCQRVDANQRGIEMRSQPMNYESLATFQPGVIEGIEANQRAALIRAMEGQGITVDERAVKVHWQLVVEGYGFPFPEGFVHPDAPDDVQAEGREAWARIVKMAGDSLSKYLFVKVWRRKNTLPSPEAKAIGGAWCSLCYEPHPTCIPAPGRMEVIASDDGVVDAEIVED